VSSSLSIALLHRIPPFHPAHHGIVSPHHQYTSYILIPPPGPPYHNTGRLHRRPRLRTCFRRGIQAGLSITSTPHTHISSSHLPILTSISLQKFAAANQANGTGSASLSGSGLTLDEACKILNVSPPKAGEANLAQVHERFKRLFDMNDPKKGGSFYLQSKVLRARERIELEVRERQALAEREEEIRTGWKPKLYKD